MKFGILSPVEVDVVFFISIIKKEERETEIKKEERRKKDRKKERKKEKRKKKKERRKKKKERRKLEGDRHVLLPKPNRPNTTSPIKEKSQNRKKLFSVFQSNKKNHLQN